ASRLARRSAKASRAASELRSASRFRAVCLVLFQRETNSRQAFTSIFQEFGKSPCYSLYIGLYKAHRIFWFGCSPRSDRAPDLSLPIPTKFDPSPACAATVLSIRIRNASHGKRNSQVVQLSEGFRLHSAGKRWQGRFRPHLRR